MFCPVKSAVFDPWRATPENNCFPDSLRSVLGHFKLPDGGW
jgi:hypothetical protein